MRKTMAKISPTAGNPPLKLNDFKDGRGKMGQRNVLHLRLKGCSMANKVNIFGIQLEYQATNKVWEECP